MEGIERERGGKEHVVAIGLCRGKYINSFYINKLTLCLLESMHLLQKKPFGTGNNTFSITIF